MAKHLQNVEQLFIGAAANITTSALNSTFVNNTGEIGIFTPDGRRLVQGSGANGALNPANSQFVIAQARGAAGEPKLLVSGVIDKAKIKSATRLVYTAATEQVDYIGYNGTSGSIEVNANELYYIQLYLEDYITSTTDGRYIKHGQYQSNTTSTQETIAFELVKSLINNFSREPKPMIRFERVNNAAASSTALGGLGNATGNLAVVYGSQYVSVTDTQDLTVGDYIRFSASATEALTDSAYEITEIVSATSFKLDVPYQGVSNATYDDDNVHLIPLASVGANFGLKLTGIAQPWVLERKFFRKLRWTTNLSEDAFGATVVTKSVGASEGSGEGEQVAEMEAFFNRSFGEEYRIGEPNIFPFRQDTVVATNYDIINLVYSQDEVGHGFVANISPKVVAIALPETAPNYAVAGTADDITDVLEELAFNVAANGNLAIT